QVMINGQALQETYVRFTASYTYPTDGKALLVPENAYFVLGDNRPMSLDSHLGWLVSANDLVGIAVPLTMPTLPWLQSATPQAVPPAATDPSTRPMPPAQRRVSVD